MPDDTDPRPSSPDGEAEPGTASQSSPSGPSDADVDGEQTQALSASELADAVQADDGAGALGPEPAIDNTPSTRAQHRRRRASAKRRWIATLVALLVVVLGAGAALAVSDAVGHSASGAGGASSPGVTTTKPSGPPCPLSGLPSQGQVPARPALAVKIDNYPQARPQSGIDQADMVFEEPVEGGITRLVAVFQCNSPSLIGPVRSARAVDVQILDQLSNPLFVHAGGIDPVLSLIDNANVIDDNVFTHASLVQNPAGRYAPYDTYVSASSVWDLNKSNTTAPTSLFNFSTTKPSGTPVTSVHIPFSSTNDNHWKWNASTGKWLLSFGQTPAMVANAGQIAASNIVIQTVHVTYGPWSENSEGALEVQSRMTGSGALTVLRNGVAVTGTWHRVSVNDPTILTDSNGSPIALQPGSTWVEIVPSTIAVTTTGPTTTTTSR